MGFVFWATAAVIGFVSTVAVSAYASGIVTMLWLIVFAIGAVSLNVVRMRHAH